MATTIDRIYAKVTRAKQHIVDFELACHAFHDTKPYRVGVKEDPQVGKRIYYVTGIDEVPLNVQAIAADGLSNLRQALDHVAYQLELVGCGAEPKQRVYYPIANSAAEYPALRARNLKCMRQDAIDAIDATEPYKRGKGHGLWQLHMLNKSDKHHLLIAASPFSRSIDLSPTIGQMFPDGVPDWAQGMQIPPAFYVPADRHPLKVGDELYNEPLSHEMKHDRQFAFDIAFDKPGVIEGEPAIKTLQDLTGLVEGLVTAFEPIFD